MKVLMKRMKALKKMMKALKKKMMMKKAKAAKKTTREPMTRAKWEAMRKKFEAGLMKRAMNRCAKTLLKEKKCTSKKECLMTCKKNMATYKAEEKKLRLAGAV